MNRDTTSVPIRPSTLDFKDHAQLMAFFECWERARGNKMAPSKHDFEGTILECPEILPNMSLVEPVSQNVFQYIYLGGDKVLRRARDQTHQNVLGAFAPNVGQFVTDWTRALLEEPFILKWKARTRLPSGMVARKINLSVVLTDDGGKPICIASAVVADKAFANEISPGGYLLGSDGLNVVPIDIGCGIPDLPRAAE